MKNLLLILYVGTRRLAGILAEAAGETVRVLRFGEVQNPEGFQRGEVAELDKALATVGNLLERLQLGEEAQELPVYILLSNPHLKMTRFSSSVYYAGYPRVITTHEIAQVVEQTRSVAPLPLSDHILQTVPESFWVNDLAGVEDPSGLEAQRLAVSLQIFTTSYASFRNLSRLFETLEFNVRGYFPKILTLPDGVLNGAEKEEEALLIDFSDGATHLVLTDEGKIIRTRSLEIGSRFLTSRIAEKWQVAARDAERLKERYGSLEENSRFGEELIPLVDRDGQKNHQIRRAEFQQAFLGFGEELVGRIQKEAAALLKEEKRSEPRLVLTGGGVKLEGLVDFLGRRWSAPIRLGTPRHVEAAPEVLMDPAWSGLVGLVRWLSSRRKEILFPSERNLWERTWVQAKEWLAAYF